VFTFDYLAETKRCCVMIKRTLVYPLALLLVATVGLSGCASLLKPKLKTEFVQVKPGEYALDKDHTAVLFKVDHLGFSKFVGRFEQVDASLSFDPENFVNSRLEATINMASVDVSNAKFERALKGRFWFDTEHYPQAYFKTVAAKRVNETQAIFTGQLTFLGVTNDIDVTVNLNGAANNLITGSYTLGFSASARLKRSDFGLDRFIPAVGDEIELEIHAEFQKASALQREQE